jgi:hypothetical protein
VSLEDLDVDQLAAREHPLSDVFVDAEDAARLIDPESGNFRANIPADHYILIPKAVADEWRDLARPRPGKFLSAFDTVQGLWRRGTLAFTPRWYFYNLIGNALQYGLMAGLDVRSLRQANRKAVQGKIRRILLGKGTGAVRDVVDPRMTSSTHAYEVGGPMTLGQLERRISDVGLAFNNRLENILRRAAYINAAKRALRSDGMVTRRQLWKMSDDELAHLIDTMPDYLKEQALQEALHFLGDYHNFSPFERVALRRVFAFYSWLRVITRLTFVTPIRYPVRSAVLSQLALIATEEQAPGDFFRPWWSREQLRVGPVAISLTGADPAATLVEPIVAAGSGGIAELGGALASQATPIVVRPLLGSFGISSVTGGGITYPPGYGGRVQAFGREPVRTNPVTRSRDTSQPPIPFSEQVLQLIPVVGPVSRALLSGQNRPYDTARTFDIARYRLGLPGAPPRYELFRPARGDLPTKPLPYGLSTIGSLLGLPVKRYDPEAEVELTLKQLEQDLQAERETRRQILRDKVLSGGG